jgi:protein-L-isoaspartate(D-aspartate) O-methyltransferase
MTDFAAARTHMVDSQVRTQDVTDLRILGAMQNLPRERFVPDRSRDLAYLDFEMPIDAGRWMLKTRALAKLLQVAAIRSTDRILDVGCGLGYSAAVLAQLGAQVIALEESGELARRARAALAGEDKVEVVIGRLADGYAQAAPYDVIVLEGATEVEPRALLNQLADGGRLVCVLGDGPAAKATVYTRSGADVGERPVFDCAAAVLPGFTRPPAFAF